MADDILQILLADDDIDDCLFFKEALEELPIHALLTVVPNGEALMELLSETEQLPDILFLDLNMPRKNGYACLVEIKKSEKLKKLPVITLSTSFEQDIVNRIYQNGAQYYIRKPNNFSQLKHLIHSAIKFAAQTHYGQPAKEDFVILQEPLYDEKK